MAAAKRAYRRRLLIVAVVAVVGVLTVTLLLRREPKRTTSSSSASLQEAPADLAKLRPQFLAGVDALQRGDGATAVKQLSSFTFGPRAVEEYRLYFLANAQQLRGDLVAARRELAKLWSRDPRLIYKDDVAFNIASIYSANSSFHEASEVYGQLATRSAQSAISAEARWNYVQARIAAGDPVAAYIAARRIVVNTPKSPRAGEAMALIRALSGIPATGAVALSLDERVERAEHLLRDGDPQNALDELAPLNADTLGAPWRQRVVLTRGLALQGVRRWADSEKTLQPLLADQFRFAAPAVRASARNNQVLASSINPVSFKTVTEKKQVGTVKVRDKKKRLVTKPRFKVTKRSVKVINPQLAIKKDAYERTYVERLKDLLDIPNDPALHKYALTTLLAVAEEKNQDAYMRELIPKLVKLDRLADPGLQRFWNKAWAAYVAGDFNGARSLMTFIRDTYTNPNIRRQSTYWLARIDEKSGRKDEAMKVYRELAAAPFNDLYAHFAEQRGAKRTRGDIHLADMPDWTEVAEKEMPRELRLAYELSALGILREARQEAQENANESNRKWSDALLGILFHEEGNHEVAYRLLRRAYPELATIEQNKVPRQFIRLYYPLRWEDKIEEEAKDRGLDPYLVMALIRQESSYNPEVKSRVGATGLMQIMPATAKDIGRKTGKPFAAARLTNPEVNIELGTYYLKEVISWVGGSEELALAAYNGGIGNVRKWQGQFRGRKADEVLESIPFAETRGYVKRITMMRSTYEQLHDELRTD